MEVRVWGSAMSRFVVSAAGGTCDSALNPKPKPTLPCQPYKPQHKPGLGFRVGSADPSASPGLSTSSRLSKDGLRSRLGFRV